MSLAFRTSQSRRTLLALAAGAALASPGPAYAQAPAQRIDKIEVTGSNIKRIEGEGALPVTVITRDEIAKSGVTRAAELLDKISAFNAGGYATYDIQGQTFHVGYDPRCANAHGRTDYLNLKHAFR